MDFPVYFKNNTNRVRYVGSVRFGVGEIKKIGYNAYTFNKDKFEAALKMHVKEDVTHVSRVSESEYRAYKEGIRAQQDKKTTIDNSLVKRYMHGKVAWTDAMREIDDMEDEKEINALLEDAASEGLSIDDIVYQTLSNKLSGPGVIRL